MQRIDTHGAGPSAAKGEYPARPNVCEKKQYVPHWAQEEFIVPLLRREIEACIGRYAKPPIGARRALDVGCGGQPFRGLLEETGYSYCGIDVNPHGVDVDFQCAIDDPLPEALVRHAPFDFALCTEVLEHVADWGAAFGNFGRLLAPGGRLLITAPQFYQLHEEPYDFWRPTLHAIDYYARRAGLNCLHRQAAGDAWDVLGTMLANCRFAAASTRLLDCAVAKAVRTCARLTSRALISRRLQRLTRVEGPLYMSNVVVLEKLEYP